MKAIAITSCLVSIGALTTLVIIVAVNGTDLLSTVALALAILAFVIQIIVYIVQTSDTNAQARRSQELHSQLLALLAEIREKASGTQQSMMTINERLLEGVFGKAKSEGISPAGPEMVRRLASTLVGADTGIPGSPSGGPTSRTSYPEPLDASAADRIHKEMRSWPPLDAMQTITALVDRLSETDLEDVYRLADDVLSSTREGAALGPGLSKPTIALLEEKLATKIDGWKLYTLTPLGRLVGRVFTATEPAPPEYENLLSIRTETIARYNQKLNSVLDNRDDE